MDITNISGTEIQTFLLVLVRVGAMVSLLPIFGSQNVPVKLKAGFSLMLTISVFPLVTVYDSTNILATVPSFAVAVIKEVFVGIVIGFATTFLFASVQFAGRLIDIQMGFAMVQMVDPFTDASATLSGQFQVLIFSIIFLLTNMHYFMIIAVKKSFEFIPLLGVHIPSGPISEFFIGMVGTVFNLAIRLSAPVFVILILSSIALGVVARTVPQMNVFFVGMPLKIGVGIGSMIILLPVFVNMFKGMTSALINDMWKLLYMMALNLDSISFNLGNFIC